MLKGLVFTNKRFYHESSIKSYQISKKGYVLWMVIDETLMEPLSTSWHMRSSKMSLSRFGSGVFSAKLIKFKY